jgi:hypothetical protein
MRRQDVRVGERYGTADIGDVIVVSPDAEKSGCVCAVKTEDWDAFQAVTRREGDWFILIEPPAPPIYFVYIAALLVNGGAE